VDALRGYQNDDGGFGHALEPDKRCPASLPIDVETAFQALATADTADRPHAAADTADRPHAAADTADRPHAAADTADRAPAAAETASRASAAADSAGRAMVRRACDFLAATAAEAGAGGAVPLAFPVIESFPRAAHWADWAYVPGLNPTAGLVGRLYQLGVDHPWVAQGAGYCWRQLETGDLPGDAHALSEVFVFLEHAPERDRADEHAARLAERFAEIPMFNLDPDASGYGLSPLSLAPAASSRWRALFTDAQINAHLDRLKRDQQPDGGWPISWEPPSEAAACEWRGIVTLNALRTLTSYGRLNAPA
jgi:hypothetical protein